MNSRERIMDDLQQQITSLLHNMSARGTLSEDPPVQNAGSPFDAAPISGGTPPKRGPEDPRLAAIGARDEEIVVELMRLQRTLSRQSFRGAESARRVVRRLIRKVRRNSEELELLDRSGFGPGSRSEHEVSQLKQSLVSMQQDLEKLRHLPADTADSHQPLFGGETQTRMPSRDPLSPERGEP